MYLEGGWYKVFKYSPIIRYMDVSLAYKQLKGTESFEGDAHPCRRESICDKYFNGEGEFNESCA